MITLLNRYLGIPLESLIAGNKEIYLEPETRAKLLNVTSIKDYLIGSGTANIKPPKLLLNILSVEIKNTKS